MDLKEWLVFDGFWMWGILLWLIWWWLASQKNHGPCNAAPGLTRQNVLRLRKVRLAAALHMLWDMQDVQPVNDLKDLWIQCLWCLNHFESIFFLERSSFTCMIQLQFLFYDLAWLGHLRTCGTAEWMPWKWVDRCPPGNRKILWEKIRYPATERMNHVHVQLEKQKRF